MTKGYIYRVSFRTAPERENGNTVFYFTSVAAIYTRFTPSQIGCRKNNLWRVGVPRGQAYRGRLCTVTREEYFTSPQRGAK
ncbi:MAG: hypothetical protein LUI04_06075 [Porphyromonadaceae bacterium]|nr:hypothetical protein [Porphyromonadaceae bacterium]